MSDHLSARLDRLERELSRLQLELVELRALARSEREHARERASGPPEEPAVAAALVPVTPPAPAGPAAPSPPAPPSRREEEPAATPPRPPARPAWAPPKVAAAPTGRTLGELARDWDLVGARGFAIAGGAVTALGIGLFFVLAANRGWIGPAERVALGAAASALVFAAGLVLRRRFGEYWAALAAVGAGIAGAYATLAAAAARYDLVPDGLALPLAGAIAAVGTVVAVRWRSQVIAGLGLLGAALAPALQSLDTELTWESAAFALVVLAAGVAVTVPRRWHELLVALSLVVGAQVQLLVRDVEAVDAGTVAVAGLLAALLLAASIGLQVVRGRGELDPLALSYGVAAFGVTLAFAAQLFDAREERGAALLVAAGVWAAALAGLLLARHADLALVAGAAALALSAVGLASLLTDAALVVAWAAEAVVLAALGRQLGDARLRTAAIGYAALAALWALGTDAAPGVLFDRDADHAAGVAPLAAAALAALAAGVLAPPAYRPRTEAGLLAFVASLRTALEELARGLAEALVFAAAALGTLAVAFAAVAVSFEGGHVAATALAAAVGAALLAAAGYRRSDWLATAAYWWLGVVLGVALVYDLDSVAGGGWAVLAASAGLLLGAFGHRLAWDESGVRDGVFAIAAATAAAAAVLGIDEVTGSTTSAGVAALLAAALLVALSASVFRRAPLRNAATTLWALGLMYAVGAELLLVDDPVWRAVLVAATAAGVGAIAAPLRETRLWLAGSALALATAVAVFLGPAYPDVEDADLRGALAAAACVLATLGLAALRFREPRWRELVTALWGAGLVLLLVTERLVLGSWEATAFAASLTSAGAAALARPLREERLWLVGTVFVGWCTAATLVALTPPSHLLTASESPAASLWVLAGCVAAVAILGLVAAGERERTVLFPAAGGLALYGVSLGILELAERISGSTVDNDFERGHTAVSALWALVGLGLLLAGLLRGSPGLRYAGLALFGLTLAKIFLYDLAELSSVARAFSFILVGGLLLAAGFFLQRLSGRMGQRPPARPRGA